MEMKRRAGKLAYLMECQDLINGGNGLQALKELEQNSETA